MKPLQYLIIHCTATQEGKELTVEDIRRMHCGPRPETNGSFYYMGKTYAQATDLPEAVRRIRGRGWRQVGYSDMIHLNGLMSNLVPYNDDQIVQPREITNGAVGLNGVSRHVVYVGGVTKNGKTPKDTRTAEQHLTLRNYVIRTLAVSPCVIILGHNQVAAKACPSFDVPEWLRSIGIKEENIYKKK